LQDAGSWLQVLFKEYQSRFPHSYSHPPHGKNPLGKFTYTISSSTGCRRSNTNP
jgi:hypothetical protein